MLGESSALGCQLIDVWCFDFLLAIAAKFSIAEVVGENKNDVRWGVLLSDRDSIHRKRTANNSKNEIRLNKELHKGVPWKSNIIYQAELRF